MTQLVNFLAISGLIIIISSFAEATISKQQIEIVRQLPVDKEYQDELIEHYDEVRDWIFDLTLAQPKAGRASIPCLACRIVLSVYMQLMRVTDDIEGIIALLKLLGCAAADWVNFLHPDVCTGALDLYKNDLHYIVDNNPDLKPIDVCIIMLGKSGENCEGERTERFYNWTIGIKGDKPAIVDSPYLPSFVTPVKILQLTDIHLDLGYVIGKNNDCQKPMCCQEIDGDGVHANSTAAGPHGDFKCDTPLSAMNELFDYAASLDNYEYEFVMMTGDIPPHNVWNTTLFGNLNHYKSTNHKLLDVFPPSAGIPIYPVFGNHEPHPCNMFPPQKIWNVSDFSKAWMYDSFANAYGDYINDPIAIDQLRQAGFYTTKHKDTKLRIIVINTNFGYNLNFWLYYHLEDPEGQLQWLSDTLASAEAAGERVYILGHMPTGSSDCWGVWSAQFERIIVRYEAIIMGQFYGHTHKDEIEIFYDSSTSPPRAVNSLYVGASATAITNLNPGFKVYYADGARGAESTWEIMDHETWIYDLVDANANVEPNGVMPWMKLYMAKEAFGLKSLRPKDLDDLVYRMLFDDNLFQKYYRFYHKDSPVRGACTSSTCKLNYICDMVIANTADYSHCDRFKAYFIVGETTTVQQPSIAGRDHFMPVTLFWVTIGSFGLRFIHV